MFAGHRPRLVWNRVNFRDHVTEEELNGEATELPKDLNQLWRKDHKYNEKKNTIVLADCAEKLPNQPYNLVRINTFDASAFDQGPDYMDRTLVKVHHLIYHLHCLVKHNKHVN